MMSQSSIIVSDGTVQKRSRDDFVARVRARSIEEGPEDIVGHAGLCLVQAHFTILELEELGCQPMLQAGSMQWPRIRVEDDDGVCDTHFAYMWEPEHRMSQMALAIGAMPEIHVWVALPDRDPGELIDLTTGSFPQACKSTINQTWDGDLPPDYLWCDGRIPPRVRYAPCFPAIYFAMTKLWDMFQPEYAEFTAEAAASGLTFEKVLAREQEINNQAAGAERSRGMA